MCTGIALPLSDLPTDLLDGLDGRRYRRGEREELQFHWWQAPAILPVRWDGALRLLRWGSRDRRSPLPFGSGLTRDQLASGTVASACPEEGVIPATLGFHRGTWFLIEEGIHAVVLPEVPGGPVVYMLTEPSTNYYRNMTGQSPFMPVFVDQVI
jgi:hypothetical protein